MLRFSKSCARLVEKIKLFQTFSKCCFIKYSLNRNLTLPAENRKYILLFIFVLVQCPGQIFQMEPEIWSMGSNCILLFIEFKILLYS